MQKVFFSLFLLCLLSACESDQNESDLFVEKLNNTSQIIFTATPFQPGDELILEDEISFFIPEYLIGKTAYGIGNYPIHTTNQPEGANCMVISENNGNNIGDLTYVLVKPFNTIQDNLSTHQFNSLLYENLDNSSLKEEIYVDQFTFDVLKSKFDNISDRFRIIPQGVLIHSVFSNKLAYGIVAFDELTPEWKVIKIDGVSPLDYDFNENTYPLNIKFSIECDDSVLFINEIIQEFDYFTNRDSQKMTSLLLTGTTALTRATANKMEQKGVFYPGEKVKMWFEQADFRHVSSETAFIEGCPFPDPFQKDLSFCSRPRYVELFGYLGINIIELTGNHLLDKGNKAFEDTLRLLSEKGFLFYAGGYFLEEASQPLIIEHNGNQLAFLGCNIAGPSNVWAGDNKSGVNPCDYDGLEKQIRSLSESGILPIVTFQYFETNYMKAPTNQIQDFRRMADAGAVIVSGSQSHVPMSMEIYNSGFIHYGLGNLFFDQMDNLMNRKGFIDRHIFYDGKHINTELLTIMIEDYAQPRPMNDYERNELLSDAFVNFLIISR